MESIMSKNLQNNNLQSTNPLSNVKIDELTEILKQNFNVQLNSIELEKKRLALSEKELNHNSEYAKKFVELEAVDRKEVRQHHKELFKHSSYIGLGIIIIVLIFLGFCIMNNAKDLAIHIITFLFGGGGGYLAGKGNALKQKVEDAKEEDK